MYKKIKKAAAWLLCLAMLAGMIPVQDQPVTAAAAGKSQTYDFTNAQVANPRDATIAANGWRVHPDKTSVATYTTNVKWISASSTFAGVLINQVNNTPRDSDFVIEFKVDQAGEYNMNLAYYCTTAGIQTDVYLDDVKIGSVDFYSDPAGYASTSFDGAKFNFEADSLHTLTFRRTGGSDYCMYLVNLTIDEISDVAISGPKAVEKGESVAIKAVGQNGQAITSGVTYAVNPEGIVSVDESGNVTGIQDGTAEITASITVGGDVITSKPHAIKVISGGGENQRIDFSGSIYEDVRDVRLLSKGWEVNKAKTAVANYTTTPGWMKWRDWGIDCYVSQSDGSLESDISIDFQVNADGLYNIDVVHVKNAAGNIADVYIDDMYIGEVDFYSADMLENQSVTINDGVVALDEGVHTVTFRRTTKNKFECFYLSGLTLRPEITSIELDCPEFAPMGQPVKLNVVDQNGNVVTQQVTYTISPQGIASIDEDGNLTGTATGTVSVTASITADGAEFTSEPKSITVIAENGEYKKIDLRGSQYDDPRNATIELNGFAVNREKTSPESWNYASWLVWRDFGLSLYIPSTDTPVSSDLALDFSVDKTGLYVLELEYMIHAAGNLAEVYIDGVPVGDLDFYNSSQVLNNRTTYADKLLALGEGVHTLTFRRTSRSRYECFYPSAIILRAPPQVTVSAEKTSLECGETTQLTLGGPWFEDPETAPAPENIYFESSDLSVLEISDTGLVTAKNSGTATVTATVINGDKSDYSYIEISVTDNSDISSAYLSGGGTIYVNNQSTLSVEILRESGDLLSASNAQISYTVVECEPAGAITVTADGKVTAAAVGTAKIKASVTVGDVTVETNTVTVTAQEMQIEEGEYEDHVFDFRTNQVGKPADATMVSHGWQLVPDASNPGFLQYATWFTYANYGMMTYTPSTTAPDSDLTLDFVIKADGIYRGKFDYLTDPEQGPSVHDVYVDGKYMGRLNTYSEVGYVAGEPIMLNSLYLEKGVHRVVFRQVSGHQYLFLTAFSLLKVEDPQPAEFVADVEKTTLAVGEVIDAQLGIMENGMPVKFGKTISGADDPDNYLDVSLSDNTVISYDQNAGKITALKEGTCTITVTGKRGDVQGNESLQITVDAEKLGSAAITTQPDELHKGERAQLSVTAFTGSGREITPGSLEVNWSVSDEQKARIENGELVCLTPGEVTLTASVKMNGETVTALKTLTIGEATGSGLIVELDSYMLKPEQSGVQIHTKGKLSDGTQTELPAGSVTYENKNPEVVSVSASGFVSPVAIGKAEIIVRAQVMGVACEETVKVAVSQGKTESTLYTAEKIAAAQGNVSEYSWARDDRNSAVLYADKYLAQGLDAIWESVTTQGLWRSPHVGYRDDPNVGSCRYCGKELTSIYGHYPWIIDHFGQPWKIQCPECRRKFPSNDFNSFYKLGIDEHGNWDYELAKANHIDMFGGLNGYGYLKNTMYPEIATVKTVNGGKGLYDTETVEGWGVDDGFGYDTGRMFAAGKQEIHSYIAYCNEWGVWYNGATKPYDRAYISGMLASFADAYMYTGEMKYGRAGAILIDRIADVYPDMDYTQHFPAYYNTDETPLGGRVVDHIWSSNLARHLAEYYDAFFPAMDDPSVISFLSEKAEQYGLSNTKADAFEIRRNCEDNLLRITYDDCVDGVIHGNFGMHHNAMATAAVVLDDAEQTREMIDWIFRTNSGTGSWWREQTDGGDFYKTIMNTVSRDGIGNEGGLGYNYLWVTNTIPIANTLAGYDGYESANLYTNAKYVKMLLGELPTVMCRRATPQVGDDGSGAASVGFAFSKDDMITAYINTGMKEFAQAAYMMNGNSSVGLYGDIFTPKAEDLANEIQQVVDEHGEYQFLDQGIQLGEYGISIMRDGGYHKSVDGTVDNQRDWWIYYGKGRGHGHADALNLGMDAYGLNVAPEMGYPTLTTGDEYLNWNHATVSHNTVVVDNTSQYGLSIPGKPLHFDDTDAVKVMDVDASTAYDAASIYRRTHVIVKVDDEVSYSVDFFRVRGGNDHLYSFHSQSQNADIQGVTLRPQSGGSFAGASVEWRRAGMANGYSYLNNVSRAKAPGTGTFSADFDVDDIWGVLEQNRDIHLRMTMLNDFDLTEVAVADGPTPDIGCPVDSFRYVLARRSGRNLDSLFTAVYEPYDGERYLNTMSSVSMTAIGGAEETLVDKAKAVRVEHKDGRVDYICYATNNQVEYEVDGLFKFKGFVGVYSVNGEDVLCKYVLDGEMIDDVTAIPSVSGTVESFTTDLSLDNYITVKFDTEVDAASLVGKYVDVDNGLAVNGAYRIWGAENIDANTVKLDVHDTTLVNGYKNPQDVYGGYIYNISVGNRATIPLSAVVDNRPVISQVRDMSTTAGRKISANISAQSPTDADITFSGSKLPRGASVDPETGAFTWTPDSNQVGVYSIGIDAISGGAVSTMYFQIEVFKSSSGSPSSSGGTVTTPTTPSTPGTGTSSGTSGDKTDTSGESGESTGNTGVSAPDTPAERFIDLGGYDWAKDAIYRLVDKGVVNGTSENTYSPAANIKRADFAIMLVRAFDITGGEGENFADVDPNKYYAEELRAARVSGIVNGVGENKFNPEGEITRQDMMLMLARALDAVGYELSEADRSVLAQFADAADISDYAADAVSRVVKDGIIAGSNGRINPLENATRAEVAVMLDRVLADAE